MTGKGPKYVLTDYRRLHPQVAGDVQPTNRVLVMGAQMVADVPRCGTDSLLRLNSDERIYFYEPEPQVQGEREERKGTQRNAQSTNSTTER
jgi:hypothetical protein